MSDPRQPDYLAAYYRACERLDQLEGGGDGINGRGGHSPEDAEPTAAEALALAIGAYERLRAARCALAFVGGRGSGADQVRIALSRVRELLEWIEGEGED